MRAVWRAGETGLLSCQVSDFADFPSAKFHVDRCRNESLRNRFFFQKNAKNDFFRRLATSGHYSYINENSLPNDASAGCLVSIFSVGINSNSLSWSVHSVQENYPKIYGDVRRHTMLSRSNSVQLCQQLLPTNSKVGKK